MFIQMLMAFKMISRLGLDIVWETERHIWFAMIFVELEIQLFIE